MLHKRIARLKQLLVATEDLTTPLNYFLERVAPDDDLRRASQRANPIFLRHLLQGVATLHYEQPTLFSAPEIFHAVAHHLWYGACRLGSRDAYVIYFDDVDVGIVSITRQPASDEVDILRFSVVRRKKSRDRN